MISTKFETVDEYINSFPVEIRNKLERIRKTIKKAAPGAKEIISYRMPAFKLYGVLVYFAAAKNHIGFYPTASPIKEFREKLASFETSKGAIKFPLDKKLPSNLIAEITRFRFKEDIENHNKKRKK